MTESVRIDSSETGVDLSDYTVEVSFDSRPGLVEVSQETFLITEKQETEIIAAVEQGPPGAPGEAGEEMPYSKRTDVVSDSLLYRAEALPGAQDDAAVWRIRRIEIGSDGDVIEKWADGNALFDNVWNDRSQLTYT